MEELKQKGVDVTIFNESSKRMRVGFNINDKFYCVYISPLFNPKIPVISFGNTDGEYKNLNLNKLLNSTNANYILAIIFSIIRWWVDKYNISVFEYAAEGDIRFKLYGYYLSKHFKDFELTSKIPLATGSNNFNYTWTKK